MCWAGHGQGEQKTSIASHRKPGTLENLQDAPWALWAPGSRCRHSKIWMTPEASSMEGGPKKSQGKDFLNLVSRHVPTEGEGLLEHVRMRADDRSELCSMYLSLKHIRYLKTMFTLYSGRLNICRCCVEDNCNIKGKGTSRGLWGSTLVLRDHEKFSMYISVPGESLKTNKHMTRDAYSYIHMNM